MNGWVVKNRIPIRRCDGRQRVKWGVTWMRGWGAPDPIRAYRFLLAQSHAHTPTRRPAGRRQAHVRALARTRALAPVLTHSLSRAHPHPLTLSRPLTHARTHSLSRAHSHSLTHSLAHARTHAHSHARTLAHTHARVNLPGRQLAVYTSSSRRT